MIHFAPPYIAHANPPQLAVHQVHQALRAHIPTPLDIGVVEPVQDAVITQPHQFLKTTIAIVLLALQGHHHIAIVIRQM